MDQYLSTYRKDFSWPYVRTFPNRNDSSHSAQVLQGQRCYRGIRCICGTESDGSTAPKEHTGLREGDTFQWSRLGPMGLPLDPKLYPVKMGSPPEFKITHDDKPNTYLKKLHKKHPYLNNVLQNAPSDEMIRHLNEDRSKTTCRDEPDEIDYNKPLAQRVNGTPITARMRSTYQADYDHLDEHPLGDYNKLLAQSEVASWPITVPRSKEIPVDCRSHVRPPNSRGQVEPSKLGNHATNCSRGFGNDAGFRSFDGVVRGVGNSGGGLDTLDGATGGRDNFKRSSCGVDRNFNANGTKDASGRGGGGIDRTDKTGFICKERDEENRKRSGKAANNQEAANQCLPTLKSEYRQQVIDQSRFTDKMHQHGSESSGRKLIEKIVAECHR